MPMLIISTNIARSKVSADLMRSCAQMFATAINKPVEKAMIHFQTG